MEEFDAMALPENVGKRKFNKNVDNLLNLLYSIFSFGVKTIQSYTKSLCKTESRTRKNSRNDATRKGENKCGN